MTRSAFLIYANRSGSTLLSAQLSKRIAPERLLVVPEFRLIEYLFHIGDARARRLELSDIQSMIDDDRQITANLGLSSRELVAALQPTIGEGTAVKLHSLLRAYTARSSLAAEPEVVLWKWGNAATYVDGIKEVFPDASFVHVIRDARAVVNSLLTTESPYFPGEDLGRGSTLYAVHHWKSSLRRNGRPGRAGLPQIDVRYFDLVRAPEQVCRRVAALLDLGTDDQRDLVGGGFRISETEKGIHRLVEESPRTERIEGWRTELAEWRRYVVERAVGSELEALGYEVSPPDATRVERLLWLGRAQVERVTGFSHWVFRRLRRYGARLTIRLFRLRMKAWLATRRTQGS